MFWTQWISFKFQEEQKEEILIHWQQKLFSAKEFDHYADPLNCISAIEKKYHDDIMFIKRYRKLLIANLNIFLY